jgi:hypothetical protein
VRGTSYKDEGKCFTIQVIFDLEILAVEVTATTQERTERWKLVTLPNWIQFRRIYHVGLDLSEIELNIQICQTPPPKRYARYYYSPQILYSPTISTTLSFPFHSPLITRPVTNSLAETRNSNPRRPSTSICSDKKTHLSNRSRKSVRHFASSSSSPSKSSSSSSSVGDWSGDVWECGTTERRRDCRS